MPIFAKNVRFLYYREANKKRHQPLKVAPMCAKAHVIRHSGCDTGFTISVAKGLNLKNATNLPNHAKNHATKKTLKRSHIFGQRRHNFGQLKIFSIAFFSQKIRNCHDLGKRRHNLSWRRHKSDILNQIIKRRHIFQLWRVHATSNFMAPQGGPKTPLWRDHATFGNTGNNKMD